MVYEGWTSQPKFWVNRRLDGGTARAIDQGKLPMRPLPSPRCLRGDCGDAPLGSVGYEASPNFRGRPRLLFGVLA
jgi:hypothetical protein